MVKVVVVKYVRMTVDGIITDESASNVGDGTKLTVIGEEVVRITFLKLVSKPKITGTEVNVVYVS